MILPVFSWWFAATLLGAIALPLVWRLLSRLRDRGYAFARAAGILAASYLFWLGATFGWLPNSLAGAVVSAALVIGLSVWMLRGKWEEFRRWLTEERRVIITVEALFLASFVVWALVRASNPDINGTEKPMELAFLNAILKSGRFPPLDPWLSGYAISYYYFGYIQLALLTQLTGVASGIAFNLGNALWFALCMVGTYGILFDLINHEKNRVRFLAPLFGPLFTIVTGNLQAFLEVLHTRRFFWTGMGTGEPQSAFWTWLGVKDLLSPPLTEVSWVPTRFYWWWRASRVVNDINLAGGEVEVIDEFPFFSFLLADNHPHLLALPFALLVLAFSLHVLHGGLRKPQRLGSFRWTKRNAFYAIMGSGVLLAVLFLQAVFQTAQLGEGFLAAVQAGVFALLKNGILLGGFGLILSMLAGGTPTVLSARELAMAAFLFGALTFLNTWDLPLYGSVFLLIIWWSQRRETFWIQVRETALAGAGMLIGGIVLFFPWYPSFASQAGGILPNIIFPTRFPQFFIMFATSLVPIAIWLFVRGRGWLARRDLRLLTGIAAGLPLMLWLFSLLLTGALAVYANQFDPISYEIAMSGLGAERTRDVIRIALERRLLAAGTVLVLGIMIAAVFVTLWKRFHSHPSHGKAEERSPGPDGTQVFILLLILVGALLVLAPEYVYLKDQFGTRMNTIFKFYFAAWTMWGLAGSYAFIKLAEEQGRGRMLAALAAIPLCLGLLYPVLGTWTKTNGFKPPQGLTLDGTAYLDLYHPDDAAAIDWMNANISGGIVAEAVGGSYSAYARISEHTGLQTVIGWPGHESQWRGSSELFAGREGDIRTLYQTRSWNEAEAILDHYQIDYVYIGPMERTTYQPLIETKFEASMQLIYSRGEVRIYARLSEANP